jgi:hypothetical protein
MYVGLLDRLVDAGGLAFWKGVFDSAFVAGGIEAVRNGARSFGVQVLASPEYLSKNPTNETHVVRLYRGFLGRYPERMRSTTGPGGSTRMRSQRPTSSTSLPPPAEFTSRLKDFFGPL